MLPCHRVVREEEPAFFFCGRVYSSRYRAYERDRPASGRARVCNTCQKAIARCLRPPCEPSVAQWPRKRTAE